MRGIERLVGIYQVNRFVLDVTLEDVEVVAVIKRAHARRLDNRSCFVNSRSALWLEIENDRGWEVADEITNAHPERLGEAEIEIRRWRETAG